MILKTDPKPDMNKGDIKIKDNFDNWNHRGEKRVIHPYMKEKSYCPWLSVKVPKIAGELLTYYPNRVKFEM